jgi:hypothetical protein
VFVGTTASTCTWSWLYLKEERMRKKLNLALIFAASLALAGCGGLWNHDTSGRDIVIKVTEKQVIPKSNGDGRDYRIWGEILQSPDSHPSKSDDGVFNVADDPLVDAGRASGLYGDLRVGRVYKVHVVGKRYATAWSGGSVWPNIVAAKEISEAPAMAMALMTPRYTPKPAGCPLIYLMSTALTC